MFARIQAEPDHGRLEDEKVSLGAGSEAEGRARVELKSLPPK